MDDYSRRGRCPVCRLTPGLCVCASLPRVALPFELAIVRHVKEELSASNTGGLLAEIVSPSRLLEFGHGRRPFDIESIRGPGVFVLYPLPGAPVVTPALAADCRSLVIPDATWPQARRQIRRWRGFRFVAAPPAPARLTLRTPPAEGRLSTIEAAAAALRAMGFADEAATLDAVVERVRPLMLHVRAKLRRDEI